MSNRDATPISDIKDLRIDVETLQPGLLSSANLREEVDAILDLLIQSKIEEARQRIQGIAPKVSSEYGRGAILALNGIVNTRTKPKGNDQGLETEKAQRSADRVAKVQIIDDFDKGYFQTVAKWAKKAKTTQAKASALQS